MAGSGRLDEREADTVGSVLVDEHERVESVARGLGHLATLGVTHHAVDDDVVERRIAGEMGPHHHHAGDPEEDDVETGDEGRCRVERFQVIRLVRPSECRERPQGG